MVCRSNEAPEPPEGTRDLPQGPPPEPPLQTMDDSDEEIDFYEGYEPLPQGPVEDDLAVWNSNLMSDSEDEEFENAEPEPMEGESSADLPELEPEPEISTQESASNIPYIESIDREVTREVWTTPRGEVNIEMNQQRAHEVMSAMANFTLPPSAYPEWAQCVSEEEWRQQLAKRINTTQENR